MNEYLEIVETAFTLESYFQTLSGHWPNQKINCIFNMLFLCVSYNYLCKHMYGQMQHVFIKDI